MEKKNLLALDIQLFAEDGAENTADNADNAENTANQNQDVENDKTNQTNDSNKDDEKKFTQKEFETSLAKELARKTKGMPNKEELKAYNEWKESQKTEEEKKAEKEKENQKVLTERDNLKRENLLLRKGVNDEDMDYVMFKVSKQEGEFEDNLTQFLKDHPKYLKSSQQKAEKQVDLGGNHDKEKVNDLSHERNILGL